MLPQLPSLARRTLPVVLLASVLAAAAWYARGPRPTTSRPVLGRANVVLITVDTLRADRVTPTLTPAIDALGRRGIVFEGARTTAPLTLPTTRLTRLPPAT